MLPAEVGRASSSRFRPRCWPSNPASICDAGQRAGHTALTVTPAWYLHNVADHGLAKILVDGKQGFADGQLCQNTVPSREVHGSHRRPN